jgi:hypothetical protein
MDCYATPWGGLATLSLLLTLNVTGCCGATCDDGVTISGDLGIPVAQPVHLRVSACRNGRCGAVTRRETDGGTQIEIGGGEYFRCVLGRSGNWYLDVFFVGDSADALEDGDVYSVTVNEVDTDNLIGTVTETVSYRETTGCGPACDVAEIRFVLANGS